MEIGMSIGFSLLVGFILFIAYIFIPLYTTKSKYQDQ